MGKHGYNRLDENVDYDDIFSSPLHEFVLSLSKVGCNIGDDEIRKLEIFARKQANLIARNFADQTPLDFAVSLGIGNSRVLELLKPK